MKKTPTVTPGGHWTEKWVLDRKRLKVIEDQTKRQDTKADIKTLFLENLNCYWEIIAEILILLAAAAAG